MIQQQTTPPANDFLSELIIGMSDGLIVPFALTAGLSRVADSGSLIVNVGVVALTAGSVAMGLGGYLTGKSEANLYKPDGGKTGKAADSPGDDKENVKAFFANLGLSEDLQAKAAEEISKDQKQLEKLLGKADPVMKILTGGAARSGLNIGLSYALGGIVPVIPYFLIDNIGDALKISALCTLLCLLVLGYFKSRITGSNPVWGAIRSTMTGALAATGAYIVANFFIQ